MNQCVPSWDFDEPPKADMLALHSNPTLDEMAELIWENGQLVMHDLCPPRVVAKGKQTTTEHSWNKPRESGTLESIVNQATQFTPPSQSSKFRDGDDLGSRFNNHRNHHCATVPTSSNTMAMGALVEEGFVRKRARVGMTGEEGSMNNYHSVMESNTNANTLDDSVSHSITQREVGGEDDHKNKKGNNEKSTVSTKRSRAAAIHNQSEGKRRDKINQRMKTLQKLVPNSSKTDKASILDEVIDYLKQLQAQVQMMSRMSMPQMMMPMAMSQQFQMAMMAQMSMGTVMGMGMGMDMNTVGQPNISGIPLVFNPAAAFMPISSWDGTSDHVPSSVTTPMANFLACQSQPMNIDAYSRMAALYQQLHRRQVSNPRPET